MTEASVLFRENDIKGAILPEKVVDKRSAEALDCVPRPQDHNYRETFNARYESNCQQHRD